MATYSKNDFRYYSNELYHHGIPKQKWGVKHGPPYPLDQEVHNRIVKGTGSKSSERVSTDIKDLLGIVKDSDDDITKYAMKRLNNSSYKNLDKWGKSENTNSLYITGLSGSGKSTIATFIADSDDVEYVNLDSYLSPMSEESKNQWQNKDLNNLLDKGDPEWRKVIKDDYSLDYKKVDYIANSIDEWSKSLYKQGKKAVVEGVQISDETLREDHSFYKDKPLMVVDTNAFISNLRGSIRDSENPIEAIDLIITRYSYTKKADEQLKKFKSEMGM